MDKSLNGEKLNRLGRSLYQVDPARRLLFLANFFFSHVDGSPSLVRKCRKPWLTQGSLGSRSPATIPTQDMFSP